MQKHLAVVLVATTLAACANPINQRTAENYYAAGERALALGNLPLAKQNFSRSMINTEIGHLGPAATGEAATKLAQVLGNLCEYDAAESIFLKAVASLEAAYGANGRRTVTTRMELAQFNFDIGRYEKALAHFDRAIADGGPALESASPKNYALMLDDYATAATHIGRSQAASEAAAKAAKIRQSAAASGALPKEEYVRYPKSCPGTGRA
jgi:tetratricopeptide (TPR) repeat protein